MSKENLERFMTQVAESEELKARIGEEIDADALIALGAEHGCEFSAEDLAPDAELSDQELDGVAGGFAIANAVFLKGGPGGKKFRLRRGLNLANVMVSSAKDVDDDGDDAARVAQVIDGTSNT